jgi:hypothetical protein
MTDLRATVDPHAAARRELHVCVEAVTVRLSPRGLAALLPPGIPVALQGIRGDRLSLRLTWKGFSGVAEALLEGTATGTLRIKFTGLRAGFIPLPVDAVLGTLLSFAPRKEGVIVRGSAVELDLQGLARRIGVELPPLQRAVVTPEGVELAFRKPES